ncbi:MAG: heavy-metal-associated domain-containing protein [Desulfurococcales archaeon]|nr:heavy-metal-associated domain-containing protein [Desulfurococcales archaeon]
MEGKVKVEIDLGKYISVELPAEEAERLIRHLTERLGYESQDASEALRYIRNFDAFYEIAKKKFKDYLVPPKSMNDMIRGTVLVDRLKLIKDGEKRVVVTFDRRVPLDEVLAALKDLGYEAEVVRREL